MPRPTSQKTIVSRLFAASDRPIYILDVGGRIVFGNQALADWLSVDVEKLPGMKCVWSGDSDNVMNRLAVPPHAKDLSEFKTTLTLPDDKREATFIALHDHEEFGATLVIVDEESPETEGSDGAGLTSTDESPFDVDALHAELIKLRAQWTEPYKLDSILGTSPAIQQVRSQVRLASRTNANVVIVGKPGSDRETIARTIHAERSQGKTPLVPMSCWLVDAEQMQKTLIEFVRHRKETGEAGMPTLLLLDVDDLDIEAQVVLRSTLAASDFSWRIVSTAKQCLGEVDESKFLTHLAFALTDLEIRIPPLSERLDDIPLLAQSVLEASKLADRRSGFDPDAIELMLRYPWPGEFAELREVVDEATHGATSSLISRDDLPKKLIYAEDADSLPDVEPERIQLDEFLGEIEAELICRAIKSAKGNRAQAARNLGISRGKLLRRIEQLGIEERTRE